MKHIAAAILLLAAAVSCGGRTSSAAKGAKNANPAALSEAAGDTGAAARTESSENATGDGTTAARAEGSGSGDASTQPKPRPGLPLRYTYRVVKVFPHDTKAYTQGLFWHNGYLYEGTGQYGSSELRKVEPESGKVVQRVSLERKYFGEGIALLDGKIYQLTWTDSLAIVYDAETFRVLKTFSYDGEGWGLTTDGEKLYMSDGSNRITVRDPKTFAEERTINVMNGSNRVRNINELEWIDGEIWANLYTTEQVARIDPSTGNVVGIIDFSRIQSPSDQTPQTDFFNGIAYDPATGNIYVTGKNWNKMYQVEIIGKK